MFYVKTEKVDQRQDDVTRRHRGDTGCGGGRNEQGDMVARDMETTEDVEETVAGWHRGVDVTEVVEETVAGWHHKERCIEGGVTEVVEETVAGWHHKERHRGDRGCGGNSGRVAS